MSQEQAVLLKPFNLEIHKQTFINYLEVIILEDGTITYAVPSHQEKLIAVARQKLNVTRDELAKLCPIEYYADYMVWLCQITGCVSLWNEFMIGTANEQQRQAIKSLIDAGLYRGTLN